MYRYIHKSSLAWHGGAALVSSCIWWANNHFNILLFLIYFQQSFQQPTFEQIT